MGKSEARIMAIGGTLMLLGIVVIGGGLVALFTWDGWTGIVPSIAGALAGLVMWMGYLWTQTR